ncbi:hypothetical protein [Rhodococcus qingshengii]|uniref:hypothetical protein n=1 Tax=Rhodococcus qingshengii TaxID=334542 RepID=UPI003701C610
MTVIARHVDSKGRNTRDRIEAVKRATPLTARETDLAVLLLDDLLDAADRYGVTLDDFDWIVDLPGACTDVIRHHDARNR